MEIEKGLCYKLANSNKKNNQSIEAQEKIKEFETGIHKCRD